MKKSVVGFVFVFLCLCILSGCATSNPSGNGSSGRALQSIQITASAHSVAAGLGEQLKATGNYSDGSTGDLTKSATWSSSNPSIATVSSAGMISSKAVGSTTITAALSGVTGSLSLTVGAPVVESVQISPSTPSVAAGLSQQLTVTGKYSDGSTQNLTSSAAWSSSNTSIATVSSSGAVAGIAAGSATITASFSGVSGSASLMVTAPIIIALSVSPPSASIAANTAQQFQATGKLSDGSMENATGLVQWTSSNSSVAAMNLNGANGLAMGLTPGTSTVTASVGSVSSTAALTITNATLTSIAVTPLSPSIPLGTVQQFIATGTFSDGTTQNITDTVIWSSSNPNQMSITVSGLATAKSLGSGVTIKATAESVSDGVAASVNASDLQSLTIKPANPTIANTTSMQLSAIGTFTNGGTIGLTDQVTWASDNTSVATVSNGVCKSVSPGTANISATLEAITDSAVFTVTNATLSSITVTPAGSTTAPGTDVAFTATGTFNDGSSQVITSDVTWASDSPSATVGVGGLATAISSGTAHISASFDGVQGSAALNVSPATLQSIAISPSTAVLAPATSLQYSAVGTFSDGSTQNIGNTVTWSTADSSVASVTSFGSVTGQSAGTTTITAKKGSVISPGAAVVVQSSQLTSVAVTPASARVAEKTGIQFLAIGTFSDGGTQDLTTSVLWSASPSSVATVGESSPMKGFATGVAAGTATITALFASEAGSATLTVTSATLNSITVTPSDPAVPVGTSERFSASGSFSDGTTQNLTTQVKWTSSNAAVATINSSGVASTVGAGDTTITASMNGVNGETTLTVQ